MQLRAVLQAGLLLAAAQSTLAASSWGFDDATVSVQRKGAGVGAGTKEKLSDKKPLSSPVPLGDSDTLKVLLTTKEGKSAAKPHQAFLLLKDADTGLDVSYPLGVKDSGKGKVELTQKDLPTQFLISSKPIDANLVIGSFGTASGYNSLAFKLDIQRNEAEPLPSLDALRYRKREEIHPTFKSDPKSPPVVISLFFALTVLGALPVLGGFWLFLGANVDHLSSAMKSAPVPHMLFVGSIVGLEGVFFLYYTSWNLFQTLPAAVAIGAVAVVSGSRALSEVQGRRLAGLR